MTVANRAHELNHTNIALPGHTAEGQENNARLHCPISATVDAILTIDARGMIQSINPATIQMFGYTSEDLIGHNVSILMPSPDKERHDEHLARYRTTGEASIIGVGREVCARRKDGTIFQAALSVSKTTVNDEPMYAGVIRDLTGRTGFTRGLNALHAVTRVLAEATSLQQATIQILRAICDALAWPFGALWQVDHHANLLRCVEVWTNGPGNLTEFASQTREMTIAHSIGLPGGVWAIGQPAWVSDIRSEPTFPRAPVAAQNGLRGAFAFPVRIGGAIYGILEFWSHDVQDPDDDLLRMMDAIGLQVGQFTERKGAEDALRQEHAQTERMLASISSILIGVDEHGTITRWNNTAVATFGLATDEVMGKTLYEVGLTWDWPHVERAIAACVKSQESIRLDALPYTNPFGNPGFLGLTLSPLIENIDQSAGALVVGMDISERKQLEVQLALAQKMESIGQLAAGIAHEINTPIQYVSDNLRFLHESFIEIHVVLEAYATFFQTVQGGPADPQTLHAMETLLADTDMDYINEEIPKAVTQALEGAERVAHIVRSMKDFSHPGSNEKTPTDVNKAIDSTVTVSRNEWKYVAGLVMDLDPALPPVPCLPGEFNQVLLNLIVNAAHAIEDVMNKANGDKGKITINTRTDGEWVEVRVADTGAGIPEEARSKIFDPFFTTKEVGKGTGQGLAIAHDVIVNKHGGTLTFETAIGQGTTFLIKLPLHSVLVQQEA